jgi:hypothetical protein
LKKKITTKNLVLQAQSVELFVMIIEFMVFLSFLECTNLARDIFNIILKTKRFLNFWHKMLNTHIIHPHTKKAEIYKPQTQRKDPKSI